MAATSSAACARHDADAPGSAARAGALYASAWVLDGVVRGAREWQANEADATTGAALATLAGHSGGVTAIAFSPDGKRVLTGSLDTTARLWSVFSAQDLVDEVKASLPRCLTPDEREHSHLHDLAPRWCHAQPMALPRSRTARN
jgi:hypothetical protein